jgi:methylmalonyl-CoA mutase N-terminal domain/subunit
MGCLDPDHPLAVHAIGTQGVSLCCLQDYRDLYAGLPLDRITMSHSLPAVFAVAGLYCVARERGLSPALLRGSVIQAPYYCEDCSYAVHMPFKLRVRMAADTIAFCAAEMPKFHAFIEDTYFISESGLDSVEEMALGFVELRGLVRELLRPASRWTASRPGSASSSTAAWTSSRRSRRFARRGASSRA